MWFTENPWPGVILFLILGGIFLGRAMSKGLGRDWILAFILFACSAGAYFLEQAIVTPGEEVELRVQEVVQACIDNKVPMVVDSISKGQVALRTLALTGLTMADIHEDMHVSDLSVEMTAQNSRALSRFRANGTVSVGNMSYSGHAATRWELTWQREEGEWRIVEIKRLNPITGEEMPVLKQSKG